MDGGSPYQGNGLSGWYSSFPLTRPGSVRLIRLLPLRDGDDYETARCEIRVTSIEDRVPAKFTALSYTWGDPVQPTAETKGQNSDSNYPPAIQSTGDTILCKSLKTCSNFCYGPVQQPLGFGSGLMQCLSTKKMKLNVAASS